MVDYVFCKDGSLLLRDTAKNIEISIENDELDNIIQECVKIGACNRAYKSLEEMSNLVDFYDEIFNTDDISLKSAIESVAVEYVDKLNNIISEFEEALFEVIVEEKSSVYNYSDIDFDDYKEGMYAE